MKLSVREMAAFSMLGALMYASRVIMQMLPNIHLLGMFIVATTLVYRKKALYPLYIYVFLEGLLSGFATWWIPYLYIWTILWAMAMLIPKKLSPLPKTIVSALFCSVHGFLFGVFYAPAQALLFGLSFKGMLAWIAAGFAFDILHGVSDFLCGLLIVPFASLMEKLNEPKRP